jgi:uncharacterized membrane protein (UPF0127 family)
MNIHARRLVWVLCVSLFVLGLYSCADGKKKEVTDSPNPKLTTSSLQIGSARVIAEVASTETERERGLMFRTALADGEGMIFVFDKDEAIAFWMKNTKLPLSLAYISSDGTIRQIVDLEPESLASIPSERSVRYALEVPRGWFSRVGVKVGDKVNMGSLPE